MTDARKIAPSRWLRHAAVVVAMAGAAPSWACDAEDHLEIATVNAWGLPAPLAPDRSGRMRRMAAWIERSGIDLVAFQEVWSGAVEHVPMDLVRSGADGDDGLALSGRRTLSEVDTLHFHRARGFDALKRKGALRGRTVIGDVPVWVVVTHLQSGYGAANARVREAQIDELLVWIAPLEGPVILLGDLNVDRCAPEDVGVFTRLEAAELVDVAEQLEVLEPTYPGDGRRYDRILVRGGDEWQVVAEQAEVVCFEDDPDESFSDHRPVRARLRVQRKATASLDEALIGD